ncbi:phage tail protein [Flammeovirga agarivorans]|uniref:Tail fiber protein n=1 Tax=Flammeovirga agarivorans TaxID=2726742 RepID=A0A7X8SQM0_9BACT|nr:phage tail protein [Flammeovirga agarivorans]NLR94616.1 tail fiber protein [Flammeovirga agarivorans]
MSLYAQSGIVVQGIARNSAYAAIKSQELTFSFTLKDETSQTVFSEESTITTDPYGVYQHVLGTGVGDDFSTVDFNASELSMIVSVIYNGNTLVISDAPFYYVPYAKSVDKATFVDDAETTPYSNDGCPVGTIVAYVGIESTVPDGWLVCDGSIIPSESSLRDLINSTTTPDLRGMFLRNIETSARYRLENGSYAEGPALNEIQKDLFEEHRHYASLTSSEDGAHTHVIDADEASNVGGDGPDKVLKNSGHESTVYRENTVSAGAHDHDVEGYTNNTGAIDTRPINYGILFIIKI